MNLTDPRAKAADEAVKHHACLRCGCTQHELVRLHKGWGGVCKILRCSSCGTEKWETVATKKPREDTGVPYVSIHCRCPKCQSVNPKVVRSAGKFRYHKCKKCGHTFKSVEQES